MTPLISICIPTYNGEKYIAEALDSALAQTYANIEIIVSDDNSSDNTLKIIESFKSKTSTPIYIYKHKPMGIGANWNNCIKKANGTYIKFLFQDDILYPRCVKKMVHVLESDASLGMVVSKRDIIYNKDYNPSVVKEWLERCEDLQKNLDLKQENGISIMDETLFKSKQFLKSPLNKVGEPTAFMFKKQILKEIGNFREDLKQILDYEFCYRLLKSYKIAIINKPLVQFRLHGNQATNINRLNEKGDDRNDQYSKILYADFLEYVDDYTRKHLLKKHNILYKILYKAKALVKIN